jgi:hypothetical protein
MPNDNIGGLMAYAYIVVPPIISFAFVLGGIANRFTESMGFRFLGGIANKFTESMGFQVPYI